MVGAPLRAVSKILIVEDDKDTRQLLKIRLGSQEYETAFAADAVGAISHQVLGKDDS